ncbi:MAG: signal peptidase I [Candidatus Pacearchaeota archaeon]|jgi:signal peptidase I
MSTIKKIRDLLKKTWNYLWNDDSIMSYILFLFFVFVIIKFVFFPSVSFIMGTSLPIVIVESCSMYHGASFDTWWETNQNLYESRDIDKEQFLSFPIKNGFSKGDIFIVKGVKSKDIKIGDIIIFVSGNSNRPIIHRVVSLDSIQTKGDNNILQFTGNNNGEKIDETNITESQIIGKVVGFKIPALGWFKLIFYEPFRSSSERGFCKAHT